MVTLQVALSFLLMMGAGVILVSLVNLRAADRGYDADHVMAANFLLPATAYPDPDVRSRLFAVGSGTSRAAPGWGPGRNGPQGAGHRPYILIGRSQLKAIPKEARERSPMDCP
jgi:hypothetical protein